jgi:tRNA pseudouridine38-40 synthase
MSINNYRMIVQYDGTNYSGWQIQANAITVQQKISDALKTILKEDINLIGSGRTDTGVHAWGQVANFKTNNNLDFYKFKYSLNSILPIDISIFKMDEVPEGFNSRFDARKRSYIYLISKIHSPFYFNYSYYYKGKIDCKKINDLAGSLIGEKDFTSFSKKSSDIENKICNIYNIQFRETKNFIIALIEANRFLHGMVRAIIGTLLYAQKENLDGEYIESVIKAKDRETAKEAVPAKGLFLFKVKY